MAQKVASLINWENSPSNKTPINEDNLNKMDVEINTIDNRVVELMGYEERVSEATDECEEYADTAKSYAVGGTGVRTGEDTDNSKYYMQQAKTYSQNAASAKTAAETARDEAEQFAPSYDETPTENSTKLVKSGGIYSAIPKKLADLTEDSTHKVVTETEKNTWNGKSDFSGSYNDLTDKPTIDTTLNSESVNAISNSAVANGLDALKVHLATQNTFTLDTVEGGILIDKVKGNTVKSKNLFDRSKATENKLIAWATGDLLDETNSISSDFIPVTNGKTYTFNFSAQVLYYDTDKTKIETETTYFGLTTTIANNAKYIRLGFRTSYNNNLNMNNADIMVNEGTTALPYEPYGLFVSGQMGLVNLADLSWVRQSVSGGYRFRTSQAYNNIKSDFDSNAVCNGYNLVSKAGDTYTHVSGLEIGSNKVYIVDDKYTDVTSFVNHLKSDNVQLLYTIETYNSDVKYALCVQEHGENYASIDSFTNASNYGVSVPCKMKKGSTYHVSGKTSGETTLKLVLVDGTNQYVVITTTNNFDVAVIPDNDVESIAFYNKVTITNLMVNEGTTALQYTPYVAKEVFISLNSPLCEGDSLTAEAETHKYGYVDLGTLNWSYNTSSNFFYVTLSSCKDGTSNLICDKYAYVPNITTDKSIYVTSGNVLAVKDLSYDNADTFKNAVKGVKLVYELATQTKTATTDEQKKALYSLESYDGKTIIDSADKYAKAEFTLRYGKSDTVAIALNAQNIAKRNEITLNSLIDTMYALSLESEV